MTLCIGPLTEYILSPHYRPKQLSASQWRFLIVKVRQCLLLLPSGVAMAEIVYKGGLNSELEILGSCMTPGVVFLPETAHAKIACIFYLGLVLFTL